MKSVSQNENGKLEPSVELQPGKDFFLEFNAVNVATRLIVGVLELTDNAGKGEVKQFRIGTSYKSPRNSVDITAQEQYINPSLRELFMVLTNPEESDNEIIIESYYTKTHHNRYHVTQFNANQEVGDSGPLSFLIRLFESPVPFAILCEDKAFGAYWNPLEGTIGLTEITNDDEWFDYAANFKMGIPDSALYKDRGADL